MVAVLGRFAMSGSCNEVAKAVNMDLVPSDVAILDLLRKQQMTVAQLSAAMQVTATAVRQRLNRLLAQQYITRTAVKAGRGRPSHRYLLTSKGERQTGANFADLAIALWQEIRSIDNLEIRRSLFERISKRLTVMYGDQIQAETIAERLDQFGDLLTDREIPFSVSKEGDLPVLTMLACPYPGLAEQDRSVCSMERMLLADVLGTSVALTECRLDGDSCCTFEVGDHSANKN
ncbi:MAG TPA: ArsR family transcriptional regulator [Planctomycetes bacterium]|nr:ArsR family transcriptional regulator [Planctomycetota bacterium]